MRNRSPIKWRELWFERLDQAGVCCKFSFCKKKISSVYFVKATGVLKSRRIKDKRRSWQGMFRCQISNLWSCITLLHYWQLLISVCLAVKLSVSSAQTVDNSGAWLRVTAHQEIFSEPKCFHVWTMIDPALSFPLQRPEEQVLIIIMAISPSFFA